MAKTAQTYRQIWQLSWPLILSNICVPLAGLIDTALLGHLPSSHYLSAAAIATSLCTLLLASFNFFRMASTSLSAQAICKSTDTASIGLLQGLFVASTIGLAMALLATPISQLGLNLMAIEPPLLMLSQQYAAIRLLAAPAIFMNFVFIGFMIGRQQSTQALWVLLVNCTVNIIADIYFIYGLSLNSEGAAWASVSADYCALLTAAFICRHYLRRPKTTLFGHSFKHYLQINRDLFIRSLCLLASFSLFNALSENLGSSVVAANAILLQLVLLQSYILDGFANATEAKVGQYHQQPKPLQRYLNSSFLFSFAAAVILLAFFAFTHHSLPAVFTHQTNVIQHIHRSVAFIVVMPLLAFPAYWLDGVAVGLGASKAMRNASLGASLLVFSPLSLTFMTFLPSNYVLWFCFLAFTVSRWLFLAYFLQRSGFTFMPRAVLSS